MTAAVVIPFRDRGNDPLRAANLRHVTQHWRGLGLPVHVVDDGRDGDAPFNRAAAYNRGAALADADVLLYVESDILIPHEQVRTALERAGLGVVVPYSQYRALSETDSALVRAGEKDPQDCPAQTRPWSESGPAVVVHRAALERVGRWDEAFEGHGHDDTAMGLAFQRAVGPLGRVEGPAYHLHHLPGYEGAHLTEDDQRATAANKARCELYEKAATAEQIRALTAGGGEEALTQTDGQLQSAAGRLMVGFPLYRQVPAEFFARWLSMDTGRVAASITVNGAYLPTAMECIVNQAFGIPGWDRLVVIEHDMIAPTWALSRIAAYSPEHAVVGSVYFGHQPPHAAVVYAETGGDYDPLTPDTIREWTQTPALYRCGAVGFGLVSIARHVLEEWPADVPMFALGDGVGSHDLWFCREAARQGHHIYVDSGIVCEHLTQVPIGIAHNQEHAFMIEGAEIRDFSYAGL